MVSWFATGMRDMLGKFILLLIVSSCSLLGSDFPIQRSGEAFGILTSKGTAWIEVKEDEGFTHRYLSPWQGSSPTNGGGFEPKILSRFEELVVGNRIWLSWYWDGHLRVKKIRLIKPTHKNGVFAGYFLEKGDKWFDARSEGGKIPWRFYVRWVGGLPENGGGYDTKSLGLLNEVDPNLPIRFSWSYDFRPRFDKFIEDTEDEEEFVPFHQGRTLRVSGDVPVSPSPTFNPFDQAPQSDPLDSVKTPASPFDQAPNPAPANPFDAIPAQPANPFEAQEKEGGNKPVEGNPFDSAPKAQPNPFEQTPLPGNPFDRLEKIEP
jgi:hypothetical protein